MERSRRERKPTARSSALEAMRAAREGGDEARDSRWDMPDEQDVYDEVNEDDYRSMVEKRREREDFVVDDNGFGYYDDGEEHFGQLSLHLESEEQREAVARALGGAL